MPALPIERQERFAQYIAGGKNQAEAYKLAGYKPNDANASSMRKKEPVAARINELIRARDRAEEKANERAIERAAISKERVLLELAKIGFANMADFMTVGPDGDPVLDFSKITRDQAAALTEVTVEDFKDGRGKDARDVRRVKFKLADKRSALELIGKELHMFIERREQGKPGDYSNLTDEQVEDKLVEQLMVRGMSEIEARKFIRNRPQERAKNGEVN